MVGKGRIGSSGFSYPAAPSSEPGGKGSKFRQERLRWGVQTLFHRLWVILALLACGGASGHANCSFRCGGMGPAVPSSRPVRSCAPAPPRTCPPGRAVSRSSAKTGTRSNDEDPRHEGTGRGRTVPCLATELKVRGVSTRPADPWNPSIEGAPLRRMWQAGVAGKRAPPVT